MIRSIIAAFLLCLPAPVLGLDFYEERGGWSIVASDDGCAMSMEYEGDGQTTVLLGKDIDGSLFISVTIIIGQRKKEKPTTSRTP